MKEFPENLKEQLGIFADETRFELRYADVFKDCDVYLVDPVVPANLGFPLMALVHSGQVRLLSSNEPEGLEYWKFVRDQIH